MGGIFTLYATISGGVDTGWTFYTPYSTTYANGHVMAMAVGIFIVGFSSIFTALNFIVTTHTMRAPGMHWFRLPLFVWALYATSLIMVLATPVLAVTLGLIALERLAGVGVFDPRLGGDPLLFQHLFWFYSHPAVYIMILPGMGVVSEMITCFSRKRLFGYKFVAYASLAIAIFGFIVWGHHMFVTSQSIYAGMVFSILSFLVSVPSAIKVFNWTATLYKGRITFHTPMLYALGFIGLFTIGGLSGLFLATMAVDMHVHGTYFVIAHFHYIMVGGMVMAYLGGIHFWWPKISGRMYNEKLAQFSAAVIFIGFNLTFLPQFVLGWIGHATALPIVPGGVAGVSCAFDGRSFGVGGRLRAPALLPDVVVLLRQARAAKSLERQWTGMERGRLAADPHELRKAPTRDQGSLRLPVPDQRPRQSRPCLSTPPVLFPSSSRPARSRRKRRRSASGLSCPRKSSSSAGCSSRTPFTG